MKDYNSRCLICLSTFFILATFFIIGCDKSKNITKISAGTAQEEAAKHMLIYPRKQFSIDIRKRKGQVLGNEVVMDVSQKLHEKFSEEELKKRHIDFLVKTFNAEEIALLNEIYARPQGRSLMNKFLTYQDKLKIFTEELELQVLTNNY